jgi:hypothetical protein
MEPEGIEASQVRLTAWNQVTPLSKYLAMALFVMMPFIGGWIGYKFAPERIIEIPVYLKTPVETDKTQKVNPVSATVPKILNDISDAYASSTYRVVTVVRIPYEFREGNYESLVIATPRLENDYTCGGKFTEKCYLFLESFPGVESKFVGTWYGGWPTLDPETIKFISTSTIEFSASGGSHGESVSALWRYNLVTASSSLISEEYTIDE